MARAQRGDAEAFRALYRDTQPRLLRYLRALAGEDAEDVASEAWLQIARDLPGFAGDVDQFRGWAAAVALIATLPPDQAEAVLLRAVVGLDAAAAGAVLGKRPGAVRTAASRGLRTLARRLGQPAE